MKSILLVALFACGQALADDMVARSGRDYVRITQAPCPPAVLALIPEGKRAVFRAAFSSVDGRDYLGCWAMRTDGLVFVVYADGDTGLVPRERFEFQPGV